jgi:hypothetical protein
MHNYWLINTLNVLNLKKNIEFKWKNTVLFNIKPIVLGVDFKFVVLIVLVVVKIEVSSLVIGISIDCLHGMFSHSWLVELKICCGKHSHLFDFLHSPNLHESTCKHVSFSSKRFSHLLFKKLKYCDWLHRHLNSIQLVPCVKYWHSSIFDKLSQILPYCIAGVQFWPFQINSFCGTLG